jgi:hypothetical protein
LAEARVYLVARHIEASPVVHTQKLGVIEHILCLPTQLKHAGLFAERHFLEQCGIPIVDTRTAEDVLWRVARISPARPGKYRWVEPARSRTIAMSQLRLPVTFTREPSPPPVMSAPSTVLSDIPSGVPLANVVMPDSLQLSSIQRTAA